MLNCALWFVDDAACVVLSVVAMGYKEPFLTDFEAAVDWGNVDRPVVVDGEIVIRPMM
jgi:hypothetical protein